MFGFASSFFNICYLCSKKGDILCDKCFQKLDTFFIDDSNTLFRYEKYIRKLILGFKFFDKPYIGKVFAKYIFMKKKVCKKLNSYDIIIPVPMSLESKKIRGYNQTEIVTREIAKSIGIEYEEGLIKAKNIKKQSSLNKVERIKNVQDAFRLKKDVYLKDKKIIIFDDIYTTGATLNECKKEVIKANPKEVLLYTLAKD